MTRYPPVRRRTVAQQAVNLRHCHPWLTVRLERDRLVAEGRMRPVVGMREYAMRLSYRTRYFPRVEILAPTPLRRRPDEPVPHTNGADHVPCLFTPDGTDWRASTWLSDTIVPWTAEWLLFYEGWRATGLWLGGGTLPGRYASPDDQPMPPEAHQSHD